MKKTILAIFGIFAMVSTVQAQQTVIIQQRPGILTDLVDAAGALIELPVALAEGIVVGTAEAAGSLLHGSTRVIVTQPPAMASASVVMPSSAIVSAPIIVQPRIIAPPPIATTPSVVVAPTPIVSAPVIHPRTTITTTYRNGSTVSVTRSASAYEIGSPVIVPVDPDHRVGPSPFANPYVYRHR